MPDQSNWRVLAVTRHSKHLPRGAVGANRFDVWLTEVDVDPAQLSSRWASAQQGVPNYFGPQRFGLRNFERAQRGENDEMAVSAARAAVFNRMLSERVRDRTWLDCPDGEPCLRADSNGWIMDATSLQIARGLADPCLPLWGPTPGVSETRQHVWQETFSRHAGDLYPCLSSQSFQPFRRRVRLRPSETDLEITPRGIRITATLGPGCFMTSLLNYMFETKDAHAANFDQ